MSQKVKLGLLGNGIGCSRAKALHETIGQLYGVDVSYIPMDLAHKSNVRIEAELERCRDESFRGVNITHPYKRDAFKYVESQANFPKGLNSVNTVLFEKECLAAHNTDYSGFCRAFTSRFGQGKRPGRVLMLGSGGVGMAIGYGLLLLNATELVLFDKNPQSSQELADQLSNTSLPTRVIERAEIVTAMQQADGLINATPMGMLQYSGNAFPIEGFARQSWAFDAVYTPENTEFLAYCRGLGIDTISGFKLFLYQGLDAFKLFTGFEVDAEKVESEFLRRYPLTNVQPNVRQAR